MIIPAVVVSFPLILVFAGYLGPFIITCPTIKILARFFFIIIGITIFKSNAQADTLDLSLSPIGFALFAELPELPGE